MSRLKPCPFCGEELITIANGQYYSHKREQDKEKQCFGAVWTFEVDDEEFIKLWNTRKPMDDVIKKIGEEIRICNAKLYVNSNDNSKTVNVLAICERRQALREVLRLIDKEVMV